MLQNPQVMRKFDCVCSAEPAVGPDYVFVAQVVNRSGDPLAHSKHMWCCNGLDHLCAAGSSKACDELVARYPTAWFPGWKPNRDQICEQAPMQLVPRTHLSTRLASLASRPKWRSA